LNPDELRFVDEWRALVRDGQVAVVGPIRQEILSGVRQERDFNRLSERLADFDDYSTHVPVKLYKLPHR
jgi:hypothetical protein